MPSDTLLGFLFGCGDKDTGPDCLDGISLEHGSIAREKIPIQTLLGHGAPIKIGLKSINLIETQDFRHIATLPRPKIRSPSHRSADLKICSPFC
jgi:hypothetical protein